VKLSQLEATEIRVDNKSAIELVKNPVHHERSKYIDERFYSIWEYIKNEEVWVVYVQSNDQVSEILTNALPKSLFENCKQMIRMKKVRGLGLWEDVRSYNHQVLIPKRHVLNPSSSSPKNQNLKKKTFRTRARDEPSRQDLTDSYLCHRQLVGEYFMPGGDINCLYI
jgi:hypothetical protein